MILTSKELVFLDSWTKQVSELHEARLGHSNIPAGSYAPAFIFSEVWRCHTVRLLDRRPCLASLECSTCCQEHAEHDEDTSDSLLHFSASLVWIIGKAEPSIRQTRG